MKFELNRQERLVKAETLNEIALMHPANMNEYGHCQLQLNQEQKHMKQDM